MGCGGGVPTLPCCYLAPSFWTGLVWVGFCVLTGAGRPRPAGLHRAEDGKEEEEERVEGKSDGEKETRKGN